MHRGHSRAPKGIVTNQAAFEITILFGQDPVFHELLPLGQPFVIGADESSDFIAPSEVGTFNLIDRDGLVAGPLGAKVQWTSADANSANANSEQGRLLELGGRCLVEIGPLTVYVRRIDEQTSAAFVGGSIAQSLAAPFRDRSMLGSFAVHGGALLLMMWALPPASSLANDLMNDDSRLLEILQDANERIEEDREEMGAGSPGEEAPTDARHSGEAGQSGDREAARTNNRMAVRGSSERVQVGRTSPVNSTTAATAGAIGLMASMTNAWNVRADSFSDAESMGHDTMSEMGLMFGTNPGASFGFGGLSLNGPGRGGGGDDTGTIGLDRLSTGLGPGGGHCNGPNCGHGTGGPGGDLGPRTSRGPGVVIRNPTTVIGNGLSAEVIRREVRRHISEVRFCYEQQLQGRADLEGRVSIRFGIGPAGTVQFADVANSTLGNPAAESCIANAVRRWRFPQPEGAGAVGVTYPFLLQSN